MNQFFFLIVTILLVGMEPFFPFGSIVVALASVIGVRRHDWFALGVIIIAGITRDVLLVSTLGIASTIGVVAWILSALGISRFGRPLLVVIVVSIISSSVLSLIEKQPILPGAIMTAILAMILSAIWGRLSESQGITLRQE